MLMTNDKTMTVGGVQRETQTAFVRAGGGISGFSLQKSRGSSHWLPEF